MKCKQIQDMMGAYLYGDLSPSDMREVRLHTQTCTQCREDLESRGRMVSAIGDVAPKLTDEDRQSIAWTVKGAVRHAETMGRQPRFRWAPAFAVAALLIAGLAVGALITTRAGKPPPPGAQAADPKGGKTSGAVVRITEERPLSSLNEEQVTASGSGPSDGTSVRRRRTSAADRMARMLRGGASFAVGARKGKKSGHDQPAQDEPVVTTGTPEQHKAEPANGGVKLPEPTAPNNAQTSEQGTGDREQGTEGKERSEGSTQ